MKELLKNKIILALFISTIIHFLVQGMLYLSNIQLGLGGVYTPSRALITKSVLFLLLLGIIWAALKGRSVLFNLLLVSFIFFLIEGIIEEKNNSISIRRLPESTPAKLKNPSTNKIKSVTSNKKTNNKQLIANKSTTNKDELLGYIPKPGNFLATNGCYNVVYTHTEDNIRDNPIKNNTKKSAILFGCSFTYGTGLANEETLAAQLALLDTTRNYLNFGMQGWGIQQSLAILENTSKENTFLQQKIEHADLGIYFYLEDHIYRLLGKNHLISYHWGGDFPFYNINLKTEEVSLDGKLGDQLSIFQKIFYFPVHISLLYKKVYFKYVYKGIEPLTSTDYEKTALAIKAIQKEFLKNNPTKKFIVVLFPNTNALDNGRIHSYLSEKKVTALDYSQLIAKEKIQDFILCPEDTHPNSKLITLLCTQINNALQN